MSHIAPRASVRSTVADPELRKLYAAEVVSGVGDGVFWVSLVVWLADQSDFGLWLTLAVIARLAPRAVLSLPAGALVDRSDLRRLLLTVESLRAVVMVALGALVAIDVAPWVVVVSILGSYTIGAPTRPALSAAIPAVAGEAHLAGANAILSTIRQIMTVVGPLVGVAVAAWSPPIGFALNGATFALAAGLIGMVRGIPGRPRRRDRGLARRRRWSLGLRHATAEGFDAVRQVPAMAPLVVLIGVMYFVRGAEMVLHVYVVRDQLEVAAGAIGLLGGAIGAGAVLAMPISARAAASGNPVRPVLAALACTALPTAALAVVQRTLTACLLLVVVGVGMVLFEVVVVVTIQRVAPHHLLGRVFGAVNGASNTGKLLGAVAAPSLVAAAGLEVSLVVVSATVLVVGGLSTRPLTVLGRAAASRRRALQPTVDVLASLGIFDGASRQTLEAIASDVVEEPIAAGTVVIHEGDESDDLFVCRGGEFEVTVEGRPVGRIVPGDWFGEIGLLDGRPRTATVRAVDDARVWRIPGATFLEVLEESGAPPSALLDGIADRLAVHR